MAETALEETLLRVIRNSPDRTLDELADAVSLPRTNFGRPLTRRLHEPIRRFVADGLVDEHNGHYRLSEHGRRSLAERALDAEP